MYSREANVPLDMPRSRADAVHSTAQIKRRVRRGIRHAESSPYVRRALAVPYDPRTVIASPIRRPVREPLETDGPATCLI